MAQQSFGDTAQAQLKSILKSASQPGKIGMSVKKPPVKKQVKVDENPNVSIKMINDDLNLHGISRT